MRGRRTLLVAALISVSAALAAAGILVAADRWGRQPVATQSSSPYRGSSPPPGIKLPAFSLPKVGGGRVSSRNLRGRLVLTTFVDSACKQSCPIIVNILGQALRHLTPGENAEITPLAFSVNPPSDTPIHVRQFLRKHRAADLIYLVDTTLHMRSIWKRFGVLPAVDTGNADVHSADVRIFDRGGVWVSTLHVAVDLTARNLVHDIRVADRGVAEGRASAGESVRLHADPSSRLASRPAHR